MKSNLQKNKIKKRDAFGHGIVFWRSDVRHDHRAAAAREEMGSRGHRVRLDWYFCRPLCRCHILFPLRAHTHAHTRSYIR